MFDKELESFIVHSLNQNANLDSMEIDVTSPATPPVEETTLVTEIMGLVARAVILVTQGRLVKQVGIAFVLLSIVAVRGFIFFADMLLKSHHRANFNISKHNITNTKRVKNRKSPLLALTWSG